MKFSCWWSFFAPFAVLHVLPKQLNLSFISQAKHCGESSCPLANFRYRVFGGFFFGEQQLPPGPATDSRLHDVCMIDSWTEMLTSSTDSFEPLLLRASLSPHWSFCPWSHLSWTSTSKENGHRTKLSPFINSLSVDWWRSELSETTPWTFLAPWKSSVLGPDSSEIVTRSRSENIFSQIYA